MLAAPPPLQQTCEPVTLLREVLRTAFEPSLRSIQVSQSETCLILSGRLTCYYHKQLAQQLVMPYLQGRRLVNEIVVLKKG